MNYFQQLSREVLRHAFDRVAEMMENAKITDQDLIWYNEFCSFLGIGWRIDVIPNLPPEVRQRFLKVACFLKRQVFPNNDLTVAALVYSDCLCGAGVIGLEASRRFFEDRRCRHEGRLLWILELIKQQSYLDAEELGLLPQELEAMILQLIDAGLVAYLGPQISKVEISDQGEQLLASLNRLTGTK
jgi:hypothetical protein